VGRMKKFHGNLKSLHKFSGQTADELIKLMIPEHIQAIK